jgi:cytoskeletal protein CcmA (bactofilin family)
MCPDFSFTEDDLDYGAGAAEKPETTQVLSVIAEDMVMEGELKLRQGIEMGGTFKGRIYSHSTLFVSPGGRVEGNVDAYNVSVKGDLRVSLIARKRLEVLEGGTFIGSLDTQPEFITLSEKAVFGKTVDAAREFQEKYFIARSTAGEALAKTEPETPGTTPPPSAEPGPSQG